MRLDPLTNLLFAVTANGTQYFNVTAMTARNGLSVLECWQLSTPIQSTGSNGLTGASVLALGSMSSFSWVMQPPGTTGGLKNAPAPVFTWVLSGLLHITLSNSSQETWLQGGRHGLIFANDANTTGHTAHFEGKDETVMLLSETQDGEVPEHSVLYGGPCRWEELVQI
ncbi:hypothetical protein K431DRAFT_282072 [Polychaeton citri CBS 116435]|uniref:Uncharacterized protein n=1 Tax=Polychaeton citri CBS 116435 TaxID=1314669 RepID=A0A9P4QE72_9PEZI|nr:hypothetical protein K431DRAFT_282072 [Polychaeton citri CBS 116435]